MIYFDKLNESIAAKGCPQGLHKKGLQSEINEEVEIPAGGGSRIITILNIEKGDKIEKN